MWRELAALFKRKPNTDEMVPVFFDGVPQLDKIPWENTHSHSRVNYYRGPGFTVWRIAEPVCPNATLIKNYLYTIQLTDALSGVWFSVDALTAQAVLFELTREGNESEDYSSVT